jgi:hypothetical protein
MPGPDLTIAATMLRQPSSARLPQAVRAEIDARKVTWVANQLPNPAGVKPCRIPGIQSGMAANNETNYLWAVVT